MLSIVFVSIALYFNLQNFPKPTGQFGVGVTEYHLVDVTRQEPNHQEDYRELMVHIWYPSTNADKSNQTFIDRDALATSLTFVHKKTGIPLWLLQGLKSTKTYEKYAAPVNQDQKSFPIIMLSNASGTMAHHYAWLGQELASHGYIVVGINHPYMAGITRFPDGRVVKTLVHEKKQKDKTAANQWKQEYLNTATQDVSFVLDTLMQLNQDSSWLLYQKLALSHIGICGHSGAGSLAMRVSLHDNRIKAGVVLDSSTRGNESLEPLSVPFLILLADQSRVYKTTYAREALEQLAYKSKSVTLTLIKGIGHGAFADLGLLLNQTLFTKIASHYVDVDLDASAGKVASVLPHIRKEILRFFDKNLKGPK